MSQIRLSEVIGPGYDEFIRSRHLYRVVKGSKGSKKSRTAAADLIWKMMKYPQANALVIRRVEKTLRQSCFTDLLWAIDRLQVSDKWKASVSPLQLTYIPTGQIIIFRGMDDATKLASITVRKGYLCWVWFEEAFELTNELEFEKVVMSIRGRIPPETGLWKQFTLTFNPWSVNSWLKPRFFDNPRPNTLAMTTTYKCNNFLGDDDIERYEALRETSPRMARIICDGDWGIAEGLVYDNWVEEEFDLKQILKEYPNAQFTFGLDFGFSISYCAFTAALVDVKAHKMWVFDEMYDRGLVNLEIAKRINEMGYGRERIIADSASPKDIMELMNGLIEEVEGEDGKPEYRKWSLPNIMPGLKGHDSLRNGIQRMQSFKIYVHPLCKNTLIEFQNYAFDTDKDGNFVDRPIKEFDHCLDALRYSLDRFFATGKGRVVEAKGEDSPSVSRPARRRVFSSIPD
ncbi:MAG: PBSX family phage terminase large subunit [Candidatus Methanomethylophilaceae archaeon]|nr:PBSX family phage terminase large subunit [Candidatus Methanomethylophilaceae archaeon]